MTSFARYSTRTFALHLWLALAALLAAALLLCLPATSLAGEGAGGRRAQSERTDSFATALSAAGLLNRGDGYASPGGSRLVRKLQLRLHRLGHDPGPIDGLFGPLTQGAVMRLQHARGLAVDGVVGPQTKAELIGRRVERPAPRLEQPARRRTVAPAEPQPDPRPGLSVDPKPSVDATPSAPSDQSSVPERSEGVALGYAVLLGALAAGLVLTALWIATGRPRPEHRREDVAAGYSRLNLGLACAALLAVFALGAASGALFASTAAPGASQETAAGTRIAHGGAPVRSPPFVEAPGPTVSTRRPRGLRQRRTQTYAVRAGDSLWPIAERLLAPGASDAAVARRVARLAALNHGRIESGDPDVIVVGESLRLP
jgi:hypothetical protein